MAEKATIARPYAKAAFEQARARNSLAAWSGLLAAGSAVVADPRVQKLLGSPSVSPKQIAEFIGDLLTQIRARAPAVGMVAGTASGGGGDSAAFDGDGRNFIATLAENRRLGFLPEIAAMFEVLRADVENVADVQVTSAETLSDAQKQRLQAALQKRLQRTVRLHCDVDAGLIGGAIVKAGDLVIDGSLKAQLMRLATQMAH